MSGANIKYDSNSSKVTMQSVQGDIRSKFATKKGEVTMCELLDKYMRRGIEEGIESGILESIRNLMETIQ